MFMVTESPPIEKEIHMADNNVIQVVNIGHSFSNTANVSLLNLAHLLHITEFQFTCANLCLSKYCQNGVIKSVSKLSDHPS